MTGLRLSKAIMLYAVIWIVLICTRGDAAPIRGIYHALSTSDAQPQQLAHDIILTLSGPIKVAIAPEYTIGSHSPSTRRQFHPTPKVFQQDKYEMPAGRPWMNVAGYSLLLYSFASFVILTLMWTKNWLNGSLEPTDRFLWGLNPFPNSRTPTHRSPALPRQQYHYRYYRDLQRRHNHRSWHGLQLTPRNGRGPPFTERDIHAAMMEHNMRRAGLIL